MSFGDNYMYVQGKSSCLTRNVSWYGIAADKQYICYNRF